MHNAQNHQGLHIPAVHRQVFEAVHLREDGAAAPRTHVSVGRRGHLQPRAVSPSQFFSCRHEFQSSVVPVGNPTFRGKLRETGLTWTCRYRKQPVSLEVTTSDKRDRRCQMETLGVGVQGSMAFIPDHSLYRFSTMPGEYGIILKTNNIGALLVSWLTILYVCSNITGTFSTKLRLRTCLPRSLRETSGTP